MKNIISMLMICLCSTSFGQFLDNFDTLIVGSNLAQTSPYWNTWSSPYKSSEEVQVVNDKSKSGNNSIYFSTNTANGGPTDIVLPFGGVYNTGQFVFQQAMFIENNKGSYFNFQATATNGTTWALNGHFIQDGNLYLTNSDNDEVLQTTYPSNQWFDFKLDINLNTNDWELLIDGVSKGTFQNLDNQVASLNLYPVNSTDMGGNGIAGFWIDDCGYTHTPYVLPNLNAGVSRLDIDTPIVGGTNIDPIIQIRNLGKTTITSFDISVTYKGVTETKSVSSLSLDSLKTYITKLGKVFNVDVNDTVISATVSNVNGNSTDDDASDDTKTVTFTALDPPPTTSVRSFSNGRHDLLKLYPNPSDQGFINVEIDAKKGDKVLVRVFDQQGKILQTIDLGSVNGTVITTIFTEEFSGGLYTVNVIAGNEVDTKRIMVK